MPSCERAGHHVDVGLDLDGIRHRIHELVVCVCLDLYRIGEWPSLESMAQPAGPQERLLRPRESLRKRIQTTCRATPGL